jgi:glycosyltransferase involved in cell wall biosynthesis
VHHPTYYTARIPRTGQPSVLTVYDMIHERYPEHFKDDPTSGQKQRWCEHADVIIAISEQTREDLVRFFGVDRDRVRVTPLGFDTPASNLPAPRDRPYLLYVGKRDGYKDGLLTMTAFADSGLAGEVDFVFFGGGEFTAEERQAISASGLTDAFVHAAGNDTMLHAHYAHAVALVYPSRYEGFGLPPLEAMSIGCPTVVADAPGVSETVGSAALSVAPGDGAALAAALSSVVHDEGLRRTLRAAGFEQCRRFSWSRTAELTAQAYADALKS